LECVSELNIVKQSKGVHTMRTNKQLLSKREQIEKMISLPLISLEAEEADRFIDYIVDESVMKNSARVIKMQKETKNIRALGLGDSRFLYPGATFNAADYTRQHTDQKITLTSKKLRGCVVIYDDDLEDNIEGDAFADHIMRMVAAKIANELDEIFWIGDQVGLGNFAATDARSQFAGWRYRIKYSQAAAGLLSGHYNIVSGRSTLMTALNETDWVLNTATAVGTIVEPTAANATGFCYIATAVAGDTQTGAAEPVWPTVLGATVIDDMVTWRCHAYDYALPGKIAEQNAATPYNWEFKYGKMLKKLPSKYKKAGLANLRFFQSDQLVQDYIDALAARSTILGDKAILGQGPLSYGQVPIVPCPNMPMTMSAADRLGAGNYGDTLLTPKGNLILGIQRQLKIESQRMAADEATYWFYSMRVDNTIENVNACVLLEKLITA
jgi:hypothetical protein